MLITERLSIAKEKFFLTFELITISPSHHFTIAIAMLEINRVTVSERCEEEVRVVVLIGVAELRYDFLEVRSPWADMISYSH